ncbi:hypothetical protein Tco_1172800 [Tanacetum coccineum]
METQKPLLKDEDGEEVDVHMYRSMIGSLMYLTSSRPDIMFVVCACARYQVNPKVSHLHVVKRIFRYLKGQPKLGLWYPKDSPFDLVAYTDSDYAGASLDRKSTTGEAEYVATSSCCGQVLWIQNQLLDYGNPRKDTQVPQPSDPSKNVADEAVHKELGDSLISDLEKTNTTQQNEIDSLKRRVKKLERKRSSRTHKLKRLYKFGLIARVESSGNEEDLDDADNEMFDVNVLNGEEVFVAGQNENVVEEVVDVAQTQKPRKPKRKDTRIPQSSDPSDNVVDEAVHKVLGDSLVRAATTASSLEVEQDSGNITKTRSKATPNESSSLGTTSGGGSRCQETIRDTIAQTRVLDLEKTKTTQANEIASLKMRVKKLEESLGEDASKHKRINAINADEEIALVSVQDDADKEMFDLDTLNGEELFVAWQNENVVEEVVDASQVSTTATTVTITTEEITLAQALEELKTSKPKVKGIVFQEPGKSTRTTISSQQSHDKGKGILIEPVEPRKKKDLMRLDEEVALKLQVEFDEKERLAREKAEKEKEANIALIEKWDDIQAKINSDLQLAKRLQPQEQEELSIKEKATLFQ